MKVKKAMRVIVVRWRDTDPGDDEMFDPRMVCISERLPSAEAALAWMRGRPAVESAEFADVTL